MNLNAINKRVIRIAFPFACLSFPRAIYMISIGEGQWHNWVYVVANPYVIAVNVYDLYKMFRRVICGQGGTEG